VAFVSEDRRGVGLLLDESIAHNIMFGAMTLKREFLVNLGITKLTSNKRVKSHAGDMIKLLDIRCVGSHQRAGSLSGGNQQKVCLARALTLKPKLLIVSEPTRGIDIGAKKLIMEHLVKLRDEMGLTIIMVSSELGELRSVCDRIAIVSDGELSAMLMPDSPDVEFGLAMSAVKSKEVS
jgi:simple sugar transport system ATP-binding protein